MEEKLIRELKLRRPLNVPSPLESPSVGAGVFLAGMFLTFLIYAL